MKPSQLGREDVYTAVLFGTLMQPNVRHHFEYLDLKDQLGNSPPPKNGARDLQACGSSSGSKVWKHQVRFPPTLFVLYLFTGIPSLSSDTRRTSVSQGRHTTCLCSTLSLTLKTQLCVSTMKDSFGWELCLISHVHASHSVLLRVNYCRRFFRSASRASYVC